MLIKALREGHLRLINEAPVEVTIERPVRQEDGAGGFKKGEPQKIGPIKVRIVPKRAGRSSNTEAGEASTDYWVIFAPYNADIRPKDRLTYEDMELEITRVIKRWYRGEIYAVQCEAEEVT
ncbi:MAG: head-tail adaptor protein [Firmicutes bacterium]|nr:head-tail adaptor protein [Bacillota bacterium]